MITSNISEIQISYKPSHQKEVRIRQSKEAYLAALSVWNPDTISLLEEFKIIFLNRNNTVQAVYPLSRGGLISTVVDPRLIFGIALKCATTALILIHNHPSGNLKPSKQDIDITKKIKEAGILLDIKILDHIIITAEGYYSFADEGLI